VRDAGLSSKADAGPDTAASVPAQAAPRLDWTVLVPATVTLLVMLWGLTSTSYWTDETATLSATSRTIPQLWQMLGRVDAVHGLYYFLLWPVVHLVGTGEFKTRLPSAVAMALACAGIAVIGRRLRSRRAGLYAGLVFAILPLVSVQGHDARPYAFETASAVLSGYLLVRAAQEPRWRWFAGYGLSLVLLGYLHMFGLVIIAAHALTLIPASRQGERRRMMAGLALRWLALRWLALRWLASVAGAAVLLIPLLWLGWLQRAGINWLKPPNWGTVTALGIGLGGTVTAFWLLAALAVLGAVRADWPDGARLRVARAAWASRDDRLLTWLALPWLVLPPAFLMAVSLIFMPVYTITYVTFCLPALALLAGAGLAALARPVRLGALLIVAVLVLPAQQTARGPHEEGWLRVASAVLEHHERPGDAVYWLNSVPSWNIAYPDGFGRLRDISLGETAAQAGRLIGLEAPMPVINQRLRSVQRLWIVEMRAWQNPPATLALAPDFRIAEKLRAGNIRMWLYVRVTPP
jgi:mannosyltransferase